MGKNQRHKKQVKSEKAKTKLKQSKTKFLPKGQNVTDVSFKVKPIVIQEQLKNSTDELVSSRRLSIKDISSRLRHHNIGVKVENCQQLRHLIAGYPNDVLQQNVAQILQGVCPLIIDTEKKVRSEALKVLKSTLSLSSVGNIEAFFSMLSSYLRCSMTHIDRSIQEDSLLLLDSLLEYAPSLVAKNADVILQNFFTLISKLRSDSNPGRTLTENLKSKHTSVRWRIKVLSRLRNIFKSICSSKCGLVDSTNTEVKAIEMENINRVPLYVDKFSACPVDFFSDNVEIFDNLTDSIANYIDILLPLLYESWVEVAPTNYMDTPETGPNNAVLKEDAASTLNCVLNVMCLCWKLAELSDEQNSNSNIRNKFDSKVTTQLVNAVLKLFPYSRMEPQNQKKISGDVFENNSDTKCLKENLLVCYVFSVLNKKLQNDNKVRTAGNVVNYLNYCLSNRNYVGCENTQLLLSVLKIIYFENLPYWKKAMVVENFSQNMLRFYQNTRMSKKDSVELFFMLCDIVQSYDNVHEGFLDLADTASQLLLEQEVQVKTLDSLLLLVKKNVAAIHESLRQKLAAIVESIPKKVIIGIDNQFMGTIKILSFYYYISLTEEDLLVLTNFADQNTKYRRFVHYVLEKQTGYGNSASVENAEFVSTI